jgi:hypothetical protein
MLDKASKLFNRIQNSLERDRAISIDLAECSYTLQQMKISVIYRMKSSSFSDEDLAAIDEIKMMAMNAANIIKEL